MFTNKDFCQSIYNYISVKVIIAGIILAKQANYILHLLIVRPIKFLKLMFNWSHKERTGFSLLAYSNLTHSNISYSFLIWKLNELKCDLLKHAPYSPDFDNCDFHIFPHLKVFTIVNGWKCNVKTIVKIYFQNYLFFHQCECFISVFRSFPLE